VTKAYRHTQRSAFALAILVVPLAAAIGLMLWTRHPIAIAATLMLACLLLLFSSLTVEVAAGVIDVSFGVGIIRRHIPIVRIRKVEVVRNHWYYGWGIRLTPHGWLWSVSGLGAVQLTFDDGRHFRIGSDEPDALAQVLKREVAGR